MGALFVLPLMAQAEGLCLCGCGRQTKIAQQTNRSDGRVKGQPMLFLNGHGCRRPVADRFWEKVDRSGGPTACWPWTGYRAPNGYGHIGVGRRVASAHRVSWDLAHPGEPIPPETPWVLHNCPGGDNPACVNPKHLFLGNPKINAEDMVAKGRNRNGGLRGEQNGQAKLTTPQVLEIRRARTEEGLSYRRLARRFGVGRTTIKDILAGRRWAWLNEEAA